MALWSRFDAKNLITAAGYERLELEQRIAAAGFLACSI